MLKDPKKFRVGFHMAGAGALNANRMGSEALVTEDGYEESVAVIHLSHFLMFNLLMPAVAKHGKDTKTKPRMIIVGSITHNPTELAGKIPPQANLGDCSGLFSGFQADEGVVMIDQGAFDGPKAYKDAKACNMLTIFEMHRRFHESTGITFNTM
jgi:protochlorophyllide reductase